ncbi:SOS response regulatory protein OraA/RecX [Curtobacterium herbarum]|uniref:regulatory protein RecX n=1 Tax=Curtobacterium herbarum TaxID=150122 RepID=UPI0020A104EF|nr:regulatory protein RecX [Curtobacterium herbarum]MCP1501448.1 SOS response regulatory protein OraA/RecX [Curtobacterium herbarum]
MTAGNDDADLAPVTDLFGARSRRGSSAAGSRAAGPEPTGPADASPGSDSTVGADVGAGADPGAGAEVNSADADTPVPLPIRGAQSEWLSPVVGDGSGRTARAEQSGYDGEEADAPTASVFSITGGEIDPADAPRPLDEQRADAERISMRALSRRGVSTSELRTMLVKQDEFDADVIEHEIERLTRVGLLDDVALATDLVNRMHARKGLGRQAIVADLRRRGIDQTAIDAALEAAADDEDDEFVRALELAAKRAGQMRGLDRATAERRLSGFLMRKGYNGGVVRVAVERALDGPRRPTTGGGTVRFE